MHLAGETEIAASRARVWAAISHPDRTAASTAQGSAQVERIDDTHFRVTVAAAGIPVQVVLSVELDDVAEPERIAGSIAGVVMGSAITGRASADLAELEPKLTKVTWLVDVTLGGLLSSFDGMLAGPLQKAAETAFEAVQEKLEAEEAAASA
jgi:carbon monoxide dehydrogenase subunit G